jgi:hypothetical protein
MRAKVAKVAKVALEPNTPHGDSESDVELGPSLPHSQNPQRGTPVDKNKGTVATWEAWFNHMATQEKRAAWCMETAVAIKEGKVLLVDTPVDHEVAQVTFLFSIILTFLACVDYVSSTWPEGDFYTCQLPYLLFIVTFKPFAVPMWYCITVAVHMAFAEATFGHSKHHRESSGALMGSPLPRTHTSRAAVLFVQVTFGIWAIAALVGSFPSFVVFLPLLIVPGFVIPMIVMYLPSAALSAATTAVRRRTWVARQADSSLKQKERTTSASLRLSMRETVLILEVAATQVVSLAIVAVTMVPFFAGQLTYAEAASHFFGGVLDLKVAFSVIFSWPDFQVPRLQIYLGLSVGVITLKYLVQVVRAASGKLEEFLTPVQAPGPWERRISEAFSWATYGIMRAVSDLVRTAVEVTVVGRKDMCRTLFNNNPKWYFGEWLGGVIKLAPNNYVVAVGPFLAAYAHPWTMVFGPDATDEDVWAFTSDEVCMAYTGAMFRHKGNATGRSFTAMSKCVWLKNLNMSACAGITGKEDSHTILSRTSPLTMLPQMFHR